MIVTFIIMIVSVLKFKFNICCFVSMETIAVTLFKLIVIAFLLQLLGIFKDQ